MQRLDFLALELTILLRNGTFIILLVLGSPFLYLAGSFRRIFLTYGHPGRLQEAAREIAERKWVVVYT